VSAPRTAAYPPASEADERAALARTWQAPAGLRGWLSNVHHTAIGRRYVVTAFVFFVLAGLEAALMRAQLAFPDNDLVGPDLYNQLFTMHGTTMMFLFAVPVMEGFAIYLVPLMVGTRNVAFPRVNALGYYLFLLGGILLYGGFALGVGPDGGWFAYTPLTGPEYSPGKRIDVWSQTVTLTELSALIVAIEVIVTALRLRAPGMSLDRIPLFVWAMLVMSFMIVFAMPSVMVASSLLAMDRLVGTHFFNPSEGGDPLLWQHLFWFFGHPEVYIIFVPALGMVSSIVSAATRRPVFGYPAMVLALATTGFIAFGLWVHHMFATTVPRLGAALFTASSLLIAIPTGVQFFCWIVSLWRARIRFTTSLLFVLGFLSTFLGGGLTGVMLASVPLDLQVHDTHFVVSHFHYTLIGGAVFPLLGAVYHWFPKLAGRLLSERLGRWNFWLALVGFHLTFFPLFLLGVQGMPRRVYRYPSELGWGGLNLLASCGAVVLAASFAVLLANVVLALRRTERAPANPWGAETLEWDTDSPPPCYSHARAPVVTSLSPLWDTPAPARVVGLRSDRCEILVTRTVDAKLEHREVLPGHSLWPLLAALATAIGLVAVIFTPWGLPLGIALLFVALLGWYLPRAGGRAELPGSEP
jgi:cytochrome c oxidase subunit I+III